MSRDFSCLSILLTVLFVVVVCVVSRADVLQLVQLIFITITAAMQDDTANRHFFENDVRSK